MIAVTHGVIYKGRLVDTGSHDGCRARARAHNVRTHGTLGEHARVIQLRHVRRGFGVFTVLDPNGLDVVGRARVQILSVRRAGCV